MHPTCQLNAGKRENIHVPLANNLFKECPFLKCFLMAPYGSIKKGATEDSPTLNDF